jgi:4a-hydroxytetrahydrobiopterin dehydratase
MEGSIMIEKLNETQIQAALSTLPKWKLVEGQLLQSTTFSDFKLAMEFVNHIAELAENAGHHPDIDIRYNKVRLGLVTHDAGGLTRKDFNLAAEIDKLV